MRKFATICTATAMSAVLIFAQGMARRNGGMPPDPQTMAERRVNMLATMLDLTDAQKAQATTIFVNATTATQDIHPKMQTARQSLADAIKKNDAGAIETQSAAIGNLMGQLMAIEGKADAGFYALLTADQQAKYDAMPRGGFGGPGMGGPGMMGRGQSRAPRSQQP